MSFNHRNFVRAQSGEPILFEQVYDVIVSHILSRDRLLTAYLPLLF